MTTASDEPMRPGPVRFDVLIIEDDDAVRRALAGSLQPHCAVVHQAPSGQEGIAMASRNHPDAILLDLGLPDMEGSEVCIAIRRFSANPIIVLSARHEENEKIALLDAGADDYVTKPFSTAELLARLRAHARRVRESADGTAPTILNLGPVRVDLSRRVAERDGQPLKLTPTEWTLLRVLVSQHGRTMTHRQLFMAVWNREYGNASLHLRVHLTHLRRKLEVNPATPAFILTDPGVGYRFELPESSR